MIKALIIIGILIALLDYALLIASSRAEDREAYQREQKREMCKRAQEICNHDCDHCAWKWRGWKE